MLVKKALALGVGIGLFLSLSETATSTGPAPAGRFGREGTVKVRVSTERAKSQVVTQGGQLVADYDAFSVLEIPAAAVPASDQIEVLADENLVLLNAGAIDTTTAAAKELRKPRATFPGKSLHLVQFAGPIRPEWYSQLEDTGVQIVTYIPSETYLVYGDAGQIAALQAQAARTPHIQWDGAYLDRYKIDPAVAQLIAEAAATASSPAEPNENLYAIQLVADPQANKATLDVIDRLAISPICNPYSMMNYLNIIAALPPTAVGQIAAQPEVVSIQRWFRPRHWDERQDQIVAGNIAGNNPSGPGYLTWLASQGFTQEQFTTSDFVVDVSDSGVDNGTTAPNHFGLYVTGVRPGTSRVAYNRLVGTPNPGSTLKGCDGHGNLNSHVIGGYDDVSGSPFADASGYHYGLGVAPFVKVGSTVIFDPSYWTNPDYTTIQSMAYNDNARISSNSWGETSGNSYNGDSQAYDYLVRDAQPSGSTYPTAGNQEMVIVFAAGNSGSSSHTVHPPATAKNIITVGAAENVQTFGGSDGCGISDSGANSANDIISFSSRGPCSDNRKKPDIVAPGTHISGGVVQTASPGPTGTADACYDGSGVCGGVSSIYFPSSGQQFYTASSGTSHSTPCVAGGCALIRQFFINHGWAVPSPALTKALLMNSARWMNGTGANDTLWSNNQGMGEMDLGETFNRGAVTPTILQDEDPINNLFTASGQNRVFTGNVADNTKPFRVTLAWTDAPGPTSGSAYLNDLNLTVVVGGNTYLGNVFSSTAKNVSTTGGSADARNNVESVWLAAGVTGAFTVTVTAATINSDGVPNVGTSTDQDFALVVYNASTCATISITPASLPNGTVGTAYTQTLTASGGAAPYTWTLQTGTLPTGLMLSSGGVTSGTPTAAGTSNLTVKATDNAGCFGTQAYSLTIACPSVSIAPTSLPNGTTGVLYNQALTASGGTSPYTWSLLSGSLPAGLTLSSTGVISSTPTAAGTSNFTVQTTDTYACTGSRIYSLTIVCPSISITPLTLPDGTEGSAYNQTLSASGGTSPYTWSLLSGTLPAGLTLSSGGVISGTPAAATTSDLTVQASDNAGCTGNRAYSLTIVCPSISITPTTLPDGVVGTGYSQTLSASGGASPYTWSLQSGALPAGLTLSPGGLISGAPTAAETANFSVQVSDTHGCTGAKAYSIATACPSISITPATLPDGIEGVAYNQALSANGGTSPYTWSLQSGTLPAGLTLSSGGVISGTPTATGPSNFTIQATDTYGCPGTRAYSLLISCGTISISPPAGALPDGTVAAAYNQTLSASGGTSPYAWSLLSGPFPAGLTLSSNGVISGTPTGAGTSSFTVQATDGAGCTASQGYSITIGCYAISIGPASLPDGVVGTPYTQTLDASGGAAPYTWSLLSGNLPAGLTLSSDGVISGTPTGTGTSNFTVQATDSAGCSTSQGFSITVGCHAISIEPASLPDGVVGTPYSQTLDATGGAAPYTWSLLSGTLPAGLTLSSDGVISGTPTGAGSSNFTVQAIDSAGCSASQGFSITVGCYAISIGPASLPDGVVGTPYSQTLDATGGAAPYTWSLQSGTLPAGLTLSSDGVISGTPTAAATSDFTVQATDSAGCSSTNLMQLTITAQQNCTALGDLNEDGNVDGLDIAPFIDCILTGSTPLGNCACGDYNGGGSVDATDVTPFINALLGL